MEEISKSATLKCPFCTEEVPEAAIACKHCHRSLAGHKTLLFLAESAQKAQSPPGSEWNAHTVGIVAGAIVLGLILGFMFY